MTAKVKAAPASITEVSPALSCSDCERAFEPGERMVCRACEESGQVAAAAEAVADNEAETDSPGKVIRDWAQRRFLLGQISLATRVELDECADDVEAGHG